ncbi:hypothetical protein CH063_03588, partial [Colletotrichum higginsianum]
GAVWRQGCEGPATDRGLTRQIRSRNPRRLGKASETHHTIKLSFQHAVSVPYGCHPCHTIPHHAIPFHAISCSKGKQLTIKYG